MKVVVTRETIDHTDFKVIERNPFRLDIDSIRLFKGITPYIVLFSGNDIIKGLPLCHTKSIIERQWRDAYRECYKALIQHRIFWYEKGTERIKSAYRQIASHKTDPVTVYVNHRVWARFDNEWDVELPEHTAIHTSAYGNVIAFEDTKNDTLELVD